MLLILIFLEVFVITQLSDEKFTISLSILKIFISNVEGGKLLMWEPKRLEQVVIQIIVYRNRLVNYEGVKTRDQPGFSDLLIGDVDCYQSVINCQRN